MNIQTPQAYSVGAGEVNGLPCINIDYILRDQDPLRSSTELNPTKVERYIVGPDNALDLAQMIIQAVRSVIDE